MAELTVRSSHSLLLIAAICIIAVLSQQPVKLPRTNFSCEKRPSGYYADLETGCRVYHMCDGLGRQFSYACPNTTLFQQRMLICDHWYMVNCSASEKDYNANLLIGQRDKPFVSDSEDHKRTPRPDILSAPYAQGFNNYGGTEEKLQIPTGSGNQLNDNTIDNGNDGVNIFSVPTHWSTELSIANRFTTVAPVTINAGLTGRPAVLNSVEDNNLTPQSTEHNRIFVSPPVIKPFTQSQPKVSFQSTKSEVSKKDEGNQRINLFTNNFLNQPSRELTAPKFSSSFPTTDQDRNVFKKTSSTTVKSIASFNNEFISNSKTTPDFAASGESQDSVFQFINRFNPEEEGFGTFEDSQTSANEYSTKSKQSDTSSSRFEIQSSSETADIATSAVKNSNIPQKTTQSTSKVFIPVPFGKENKLNTVFPEQSLERNPTTKDINGENEIDTRGIRKPSVELLPPKTEYSEVTASTMGPPIYYEWKWAAPALELEPPKFDTETKSDNQTLSNDGKPDFSLPSSTTESTSSKTQLTRQTTLDQKTSEGKNEYKVSTYFIPDYIFPLDKQHPGYEESDAQTSFQVKIPRTTNQQHPYYGENAECPQCHPSFVQPGTCKPCVMIRR